VRHELLDHYFLCALPRQGHGLGVRNDDFFEMVEIVAVDVVSLPDAADWHLLQLIFTEYSRESPYRVSPYATL